MQLQLEDDEQKPFIIVQKILETERIKMVYSCIYVLVFVIQQFNYTNAYQELASYLMLVIVGISILIYFYGMFY